MEHIAAHECQLTRIPAAVAIPIGLILYGWTAQYKVQFVVPIIGTGFVGFGMNLAMVQFRSRRRSVFSLADIVTVGSHDVSRRRLWHLQCFCHSSQYSLKICVASPSSELTNADLTTSIAGALVPLAGGPLYTNLGLGWGNTLLAFLAAAMIPLPFAFLKWGKHIREKYQVKL